MAAQRATGHLECQPDLIERRYAKRHPLRMPFYVPGASFEIGTGRSARHGLEKGDENAVAGKAQFKG